MLLNYPSQKELTPHIRLLFNRKGGLIRERGATVFERYREIAHPPRKL